MITIDEASKLLGVTPKTMRLWEKEGKITSFKTEGGHRRYNKDQILYLQHFKILDKENLLNQIDLIEKNVQSLKTSLNKIK